MSIPNFFIISSFTFSFTYCLHNTTIGISLEYTLFISLVIFDLLFDSLYCFSNDTSLASVYCDGLVKEFSVANNFDISVVNHISIVFINTSYSPAVSLPSN